jgi:hypothetical protein
VTALSGSQLGHLPFNPDKLKKIPFSLRYKMITGYLMSVFWFVVFYFAG